MFKNINAVVMPFKMLALQYFFFLFFFYISTITILYIIVS